MDEIHKNTILIIDDEEGNRQVLSHILGSEYTIYTAGNGIDAIDSARNLLPDLILLDIVMPGMDGYEVRTALKNSETTDQIPVIFITSLGTSEDEARGLALDAADYIIKPFVSQIIKLRVRNQMQILNQLRIIERLSMIDQLTNIPNRRSFDTRLGMEWKQSVRETTPISLLMMDIDKFKVYNDLYGHQQGDVVLKTAAETFMKSLKRPTDFAARWGGEEFAVLLPNTHLDGALSVAEIIRTDMEKVVIPCADGTETKVTISIGVNTITPDITSCVESFISKADEALYAAKQAGRNRVAH